MRSTKYYQYGNPLKATFFKHYCIDCGHMLRKRKHSRVVNSKSVEAKYYNFSCGESSYIIGDCNFIHYLFFCDKCNKRTEYVTQLSFENHVKRMKKIHVKLLKFIQPEKIKKVWIDKDDNILEKEPDLLETKKIMFLINLQEKDFYIPCSIIRKTKHWERPEEIIRDKDFKNAFKQLKQLNK